MTVSPPRRKSRIVFWLAAILILTGIVATALLANDRRNLRFLAYRYHIGWLGYETVMPPKKLPQAKQGPRPVAPPPSPPAVVKPVATRLFTNLNSAPSFFLRRWKIAGEKACNAISRAGFPVGPGIRAPSTIRHSNAATRRRCRRQQRKNNLRSSSSSAARRKARSAVSGSRRSCPRPPPGRSYRQNSRAWSTPSSRLSAGATSAMPRTALEGSRTSHSRASAQGLHSLTNSPIRAVSTSFSTSTGPPATASSRPIFRHVKWLPLPEITARK